MFSLLIVNFGLKVKHPNGKKKKKVFWKKKKKLSRGKKVGVGRQLQINGPHQANLVLIAYASSEGSGEPAHPRSLARTSAARSYKQ